VLHRDLSLAYIERSCLKTIFFKKINVHHFDSINKKTQVTQERSYSEDRKRGKALAITKETAGQQ
jgi:hypothetical protein